MDAVPPPDLDRLLADTAFVRRIARALVRDPEAADDLAQDAMVVALERPPREGTSLRGWIATVVRTLAIDRARKTGARQRNEARAPERDPVPRPDEIVARLDLSRHVAEALRELDEPYRTALYLRYVEELEPPAIAEKLGVPVATAKTRLRRGLENLRKRFDREWGRRETWSALLVPWVGPEVHGTLGTGSLLVSAGLKIAAALLLCGAAAWMLWPAPASTSFARIAPRANVDQHGLADPGHDERSRKVVSTTEPDVVTNANAAPKWPFLRALDERHFPDAHAHARLHVDHFGDEDADGDEHGIVRFGRLPHLLDERREATVLAWDDQGRAVAARRTIPRIDEAVLLPQEIEPLLGLGDLVLAPGSSLVVRVAGVNGPAAGARLALFGGSARIPLVETQVDAAGEARFDHLPATSILATAELGDRAGRSTTVLAPGRPGELAIVLLPERTIEALVVDAVTKAPIRDARVHVSEGFMLTSEDDLEGHGRTYGGSSRSLLEAPPTDEHGRTTIRGLPAQGSYSAIADASGYGRPLPPRGDFSIPPDESSVTIALDPLHPRTVRWPIVEGEVAAPPEGTILRLRDRPDRFDHDFTTAPPATARIEGGAIVADGVLDRMDAAIAVAPDGALAQLRVADERNTGEAVSFRAPRRLEVHVLGADGSPARNVAVWIHDERNHLLLPEARTDAQGLVLFSALWDRSVHVNADGLHRGPIDLAAGDARVEGRIGAGLGDTRVVSVRLLLDGTPGLPRNYAVVGNHARNVDEDPATGVVHVQFTPGTDVERVSLRATASGYLPVSFVLSGDALDPDHVTDVELHRAASLLAHVRPPRSGSVRLRIEPWDPVKNAWVTDSIHRVEDERYAPNAPDDGYLFDGLSAGRYRVHDLGSDRATAGVDVDLGRQGELELDLSDIVKVRGIIEMPPNPSPWYAHVVVEGEGLARSDLSSMRGSEPAAGHYLLDGEGHFELLVSAAHPTTLRAEHPFLSPDPQMGSAVVQGDGEYVHLKLVAGDEVQIPMAALNLGTQIDRLRVYAYRGDPVGEPQAWFQALVIDGVARFSGLAPGKWTLWIECDERHAPIVVRDLQVVKGITRVETSATLGSTLRVRALDGSSKPPSLWVRGEHVGEPVHFRGAFSQGESPVLATGFGRGTYAVSIFANDKLVLKRTIEFDGAHDVDLDVDPRAAAK